MANIKIAFNSVIFLLIFHSECFTQVLWNTSNLNLNPGGVIYDVEYDPFNEVYILVGNFNSINSQTVYNYAVLNANDLSVNNNPNLNPINSIDGEIRTVELVQVSELFSYTSYIIYIGGNFQTVNSSNHVGAAELKSHHPVFLPPSPIDYNLTSWNPQVDMDPIFHGINDIEIQNDTVYFVGDFFFAGASPTQNSDIFIYDIKNNDFLPEIGFSGYPQAEFYNVESYNNNIYLLGTDAGMSDIFHRLNNTNTVDPVFNYDVYGSNGVYSSVQLDDSLILVNYDYAAVDNQGERILVHRLSDGSEKADHELTPQSGDNIGGLGGGKLAIANYKNYVFIGSDLSGFNLYSFEVISGTGPVSSPNWNANVNSNLNYHKYNSIFVEENNLFLSTNDLTQVDGQAVQSLAVFCLEPHDPTYFYQYDTTVCPGQTVTYAIQTVNYADGFVWEYTGTGTDFKADGDVESVEICDGSNYNSITIEFKYPFSAGELKVTPFAYCNGTLDTLFSETISLNIYSNPLPDVDAGLDTAFNCTIDTILLVGTSTTPNVTYEWTPPAPQSVVANDSIIAYMDNMYIFKVVDTLGCPNYDTLYIGQDTIKPDISVPPGPYDLTCSDTVKIFQGSSTNPDTLTYWIQLSDYSVHQNPISVGLPGTYRYVVQDITNTCSDSLDILVFLNQPQPNINVQGYPPLNPAVSLDTLTCFEPILNLICGSDTANTTATWTDSDSTNQIGDAINITVPGNYYILVTNNDNGCQNFTGINIAEFKNPPDVILPTVGNFNCSVDSLVLDGESTFLDVVMTWTGDSISASPDPITVYSPGNYFLEVLRNDNGCSEIDSIEIAFVPEIEVSAGNDTIACDQTMITANADVTGNIQNISYQWNNGGTGQVEIYFAGADNFAAVEVFGDNNCYGSDTLWIDLPPVPVIEFEGFQPCGDDGLGQIVASPQSGFGPFLYSKDNGLSYQSSPVIDGLSTGIHDIWVKDSLGCDYFFQAEINENSSLPESDFLFSTYNFQEDTIVLVNISNPPADSVEWIIPSQLEIIDENPLTPMIILPDTGIFDITLNAYYGTCLVSKTKQVYSTLFDSTVATLYNQNGIKSIDLYPNPNSGQFTVEVEFYKSQRSVIVVNDMSGNSYFTEDYDESDTIIQQIIMDNTTIAGTYVLYIVSEFDSATITFILNK